MYKKVNTFYQVRVGEYDLVSKLYEKEAYCFPIVGSVIQSTQVGGIYTLKGYEKRAYFVMHKFGSAQIVGSYDNNYISMLSKWLFEDKAFPYPKLRLLVSEPSLDCSQFAVISRRAQFRLPKNWALNGDLSKRLSILPITEKNIKEVNSEFRIDLFNRFWHSKTTFLDSGLGFVLLYDGKLASLCYSAAIWNNTAEIDVITLEQFRKLNLAKIVCSHFITECLSKGITPSWDCFTNNLGSMNLAKSLGFKQILPDYSLYTFSKQLS